jgi:hypothetical protein
MAETRPDPDRAVDREAIDAHARKLAAEKFRRDLEKFAKLQDQPLSLKETLGVVLAVVAVIFVVGLLMMAKRP